MKRTIFILGIFLIIIFITKSWFTPSVITGGDLRYQFPEMLNNFTAYPFAWDLQRGSGLGGNYVSFLWNNVITSVPIGVLGGQLKLPWIIIERLLFFYPFLIISFVSSLFLAKKILRQSSFALLSPFLFILNTYILMVIAGGQTQIALAYAFSPLILSFFIEAIDNFKETKKVNINTSLLLGTLLSLQVAMDTRIVFVTMISVVLYYLLQINIKDYVFNLKCFLFLFILPYGIVFLLHAFWIFPLIFFHHNPLSELGSAYSTTAAVKYFSSFATYENTLSLLHPYWPENIFGKTYFMRPEFLLLPILAYASLLFVLKRAKTQKPNIKYGIATQLKSKKKVVQIVEEGSRETQKILYFSLLGLLGAFLAKGANGPFGDIYVQLFSNVPGFGLFRDATKFYLLIALSYSILIPFTIDSVCNLLKSRTDKEDNIQRFIPYIFVTIILLYFLLLLRPALMHSIGGTLQSHTLPSNYVALEDFLSKDTGYSRTLWMPTAPRFAFYSSRHPALVMDSFFATPDLPTLLGKIKSPHIKNFLQQSAVSYIIIPEDVDSEIFLTERKYDDTKYQKVVKTLQTISWLKEVQSFGKIVVFAVANPEDHFWSNDKRMKIAYSFVNPTKYQVIVKNAKKSDLLIFSEAYDQTWIAKESSSEIVSRKYDTFFNSFILPKGGNYTITVFYKQQQWVDAGVIISVTAFMFIIAYLFIFVVIGESDSSKRSRIETQVHNNKNHNI